MWNADGVSSYDLVTYYNIDTRHVLVLLFVLVEGQRSQVYKMRLITVEPVLFGYVFALALSSPLVQRYIVDQLSAAHDFTKGEDTKLCKNDTNVSENITRLENLVQTEASHWFIGLSLSCKYRILILQYQICNLLMFL